MSSAIVYMLGVVAGVWGVGVVTHIATRKARKRVDTARGLLQTMQVANTNAEDAFRRGDMEAFDLYQAEFYGINAELNNLMGDQS